jgi:hypothetical protein
MGYLDNTSVTVDAILTLKGRELLARGGDAFKITQFALGDDEIDYSLWNPDHPLGTNYYGTIIENMPVTEAIPDETQALKYKLVTLPKQTTNIPVINVGNTSIILAAPGNSAVITPNTSNFQGGNSNLGYTAILSDSSVADIQVTQALQNSVLPTTPNFIGDNEDAQSVARSEACRRPSPRAPVLCCSAGSLFFHSPDHPCIDGQHSCLSCAQRRCRGACACAARARP